MSYFGDILEDGDKRMDYKVEEPEKFDDPKLLTVKCKSSPGNGAELSQSMDMVRGKTAGEVDFKYKTEIKKKFDEQNELKFTATNKDYEVVYEHTPEALNKDGMESQIEVTAKCIPKDSDWSGSAELKVGGFEVGPIKPWTELQFETNKAKAHELTYTQNLVYDSNFHCAWKLKTDLKSLTEAYGLLALMNTTYGNFYFRSNCLKRLVGLGCQYKINDNAHHATEVQYDFLDKKAAGIYGLPLFWRFGAQYSTSNGMKGNYHVAFGQKFMLRQKWEIPISKQTKFVFQDQIDLKGMWNDSANTPVAFGISLEYKL